MMGGNNFREEHFIPREKVKGVKVACKKKCTNADHVVDHVELVVRMHEAQVQKTAELRCRARHYVEEGDWSDQRHVPKS